MQNINFEYIPYNLEENILHKKIKNINKSENLIVVQSEIDKNFFTTVANENKLKKNNNIISLDSFLEKIFFTDKYILRDIKRFMAFYLSISKKEDIKEKFNIKSYHDSIEPADDFFEYYSHFSDLDKNSLKKINLATWQKEKINNFSMLKKEIDKFLKKNSYLPIDWLNKIENLDLYFLKEYKKIIFFDVVDFPENFKNILEKIREKFNIEIILQMQRGDFKEEELKLEKISYVADNKNIEILKYKNDFEAYPHIIEEILENSNFYAEMNKTEDSYSLFNKNSIYLFNDSKLYKIIEAYVNLFEAVEISYGDSVSLSPNPAGLGATPQTPNINSSREQMELVGNSSHDKPANREMWVETKNNLKIDNNFKAGFGGGSPHDKPASRKAWAGQKFLNISKLKENIFTPAFMEFYGLDREDIKTFDKFLNHNYIYLSLEKLKSNYFDYLFTDGSEKNENLQKKLIEILDNLFEIDKIKNISDLNNFFTDKFFNNKENKEFFIENKFSNLYDMFYEILGLLNTNENMEFFGNFKKIFSSNLGQNIFLLFFNHLNNITLYSTKPIISDENIIDKARETSIKNLYAIKNLLIDKEEENIILNLTANSLLKIQSKFSLFTEAQKKKLNLKTKEDLILYEKYRLYQNLVSLGKIKFFLLYDLENNIDFSSFVYEFIEFYKFKERELISSEDLMKIFYETYKYKGDSVSLSPDPAGLGAMPLTPNRNLVGEEVKLWDNNSHDEPTTEIKNKFEVDNDLKAGAGGDSPHDKPAAGQASKAFKKEISDFERRNENGEKVYQLRIGAYDYEALQKETFFFLKNICKLNPEKDIKEITGFSSGTFGNILHKTMENLFKDKWKDILNSKTNLLFERKEIEKYLLKTLNNFELKLEIFINSYFKEIILPKLIKNIEIFLNLLYKEIEQDKIIRIEAEKKNWQESSFLKTKIQDRELEVILTGRADFVMETDRAKYIIDFKTGGVQKDQLDFYAVMLFGKNKEEDKKEIFTAYYNFWKENTDKIDFKAIDLDTATTQIKEKILNFLENENYIVPKEKDLKKDEFNFSQFYNYERICRNLINGSDENE